MGISNESISIAAGPVRSVNRSETKAPGDSGRPEAHDSRGVIAQHAELYDTVRARTTGIVAPLEIEDYVVQTAPYMSPPRWHLGHTTWFFEMILKDYVPGYRVHSQDYLYYFNSYYEKFGSRIDKGRRGTKSRPTVRETIEYRRLVDERMQGLFASLDCSPGSREVLRLVRLGLEHEMQHQELMVYDIKHLLADLYRPPAAIPGPPGQPVSGMVEIERGLFELGYSGDGFAYDNEKPRHLVYLQDYRIARAPVTNGEYLEFIRAGGYRDYNWWHSEGWAALHQEAWEAPLYWECVDGQWMIRDFSGLNMVESKSGEPVCHISFFEASAYAKWCGKRLPTEAEWEKAACFDPETQTKRALPWGNTPPSSGTANLFESAVWGVAPVGAYPEGQSAYGCHQMIGDVWEWTVSDYSPYPGFKSEFDEYNDKWFVGQKVLRGGCFATPRSHIRSTYRNFFGPHERWMVAGLRLADTV
jgi:ergothioneine biosynthesis protein EgtB